MKKWFQKQVKKLIAWLYDLIEEERKSREALIAALLAQALDAKQAERDEKQKQAAKDYLKAIEARREKCNHIKGRNRSLSSYRDYALWHHTLPDGAEIIKCAICGKPWTPASPDWADALKMMQQSTNTHTSSEVSFGKFKDQDKVQTDAQMQAQVQQNERDAETKLIGDHRFGPWVSDGYVERVWVKMLKKLTRKKKLDKAKTIK